MALNVTMYLLLKGAQVQQPDGASVKDFAVAGNSGSMIQAHPVMARLEQWNSMSQTLEDKVESKVEGLSQQVKNLVKAAKLIKSEQDGRGSDDGSLSEEGEADEPVPLTYKIDDPKEDKTGGGFQSASSFSDDEENDEEEVNRQVLNEAKFGLRQSEVKSSVKKKSGKKRNIVALEDFGDHDVEDSTKMAKSFASTINAIEQRSKTRKRRSAPLAEQLDEPEDADDQLRRGLQMMEEELGKLEGGDEDEGGMDFEGGSENEIDDELDGADFYSKIASRSKAKKAYKKSLYKVAPKFPSIDQEIAGERAISNTIQKNRGLVPHKAKINRNPRVKKREQYRKALIRRRGAVREIRTEEGHKYGGETTGIKSGLSRSRKL
jgi:U3 small nucleolar RNA-associated protein 3